MKTAAIYTLGCKLNQVDSEAIRESFEKAGYTIVPFEGDADVYVINTCTVTGIADHQARQMVRRAVRRKEGRPGAKVVLTGCYAQTRPESARDSLPGVDLIAGNPDKERIPQLLEECLGDGNIICVRDVFSEEEFRPFRIESFSDHARAFLRIQEGCNRRCSYCIVPYARGRSRSAPPEEVISQARRFARSGYEEIVIAGIHIGRYGEDLSPRESLAGILPAISGVEGVRRIRLSSIDPKEFTTELYRALEEVREKLCPQFHISLQSGDDGILRAMRRDYTADCFREVTGRLRELFPDAAIGGDVIVGFPGETDAAFEATRRLIRETAPAYLHVFRYSPRPGTPAADMEDQVPDGVKKERSRVLHEMRRELGAAFRAKFEGGEMEVLVEGRRKGVEGRLTGLTRNYIRVYFDGPDEIVGKIARVRIISAVPGGLVGEPV